MEILIGGFLVITFIGFVIFAMKGGNLTVGFFVMAFLWTLASGIGLRAVDEIFTQPVLNYGKTAAYIIFGSWFGRVLVDTGIAGSISKKTKKVGLRSPVLASILISLVIVLIFTSSYGVGSAIAVGVILFPIMFSIGIPKNIATVIFTLSIGAAMYVNNVLFVQFQVFFPGVSWDTRYQKFGFVALAVQVVVIIIFILFNAKKIKNGTPIEVETDDMEVQEQPIYTFILPIVPVALSIFAKWDAIPALILSILLVFLLTGKMRHYKTFVDTMNVTIKVAISDIAGLLVMLFCLTMFQAAALAAMDKFSEPLGNLIPNKPLLLTIIFCIVAPLCLFRGPLMLYGAGAAVAALFVGTGQFNEYFLYGLFVVPSIMGISSCITQSWNLWSVNYTKVNTKSFLMTGVPWAWVATVINLFVAYYML